MIDDDVHPLDVEVHAVGRAVRLHPVGLLIDVGHVHEDRAADGGVVPPAALRLHLGHGLVDVDRNGLDLGVGRSLSRLGLARRRLGGHLGLLGHRLGLLLGAVLGVELGFQCRHLGLQLFHFEGKAGRSALALVRSGGVVHVVMSDRLGLRNRPEAQHEQRAESGPAQQRGLAHHVSDPFLNIPVARRRMLSLAVHYPSSVTAG